MQSPKVNTGRYQFNWIRECGNICYDPVSYSIFSTSPEAAARELYAKHIGGRQKSNAVTKLVWNEFVLSATQGNRRVGTLVLTETPLDFTRVPDEDTGKLESALDNTTEFVENNSLLDLTQTSDMDDFVSESTSIGNSVGKLVRTTVGKRPKKR